MHARIARSCFNIYFKPRSDDEGRPMMTYFQNFLSPLAGETNFPLTQFNKQSTPGRINLHINYNVHHDYESKL